MTGGPPLENQVLLHLDDDELKYLQTRKAQDGISFNSWFRALLWADMGLRDTENWPKVVAFGFAITRERRNAATSNAAPG